MGFSFKCERRSMRILSHTRSLLAALLLTAATLAAPAPTPPAAPPLAPAPSATRELLRPFLASGQLHEGRVAVEDALLKFEANDELRFQLGLIQVLEGVQTYAQTMYRYGVNDSATEGLIPFLRLPVPANPRPETVSYEQARAALDELLQDLARAAATLDAIPDATAINYPLHFGEIRLDLNGDGKADDAEKLWRLYAELNGRSFPVTNGDKFGMHLDAGDVRWLQGYCHLLRALGNTALAYDMSDLFDRCAHLVFARPVTPYPWLQAESAASRDATEFGKIADLVTAVHSISFPVQQSGRLLAALEDLQQVTALSRRSWACILKETDNSAEWIPNPRQRSVVPNSKVTQPMVSAWLKFLDEADDLLAGRKLIPFWRGNETRGLNLRRVFLEPQPFDLVLWAQGTAATPYLEAGTLTSPGFWERLDRVFRGDFVGFAIWFN